MKNQLILFIFTLMLSGCSCRNDNGVIRVSKNKLGLIKPNSSHEAYKIIDTTSLYEILSAKNLVFNEYTKSLRKSYLKFYSNGRVGKFYIFYDNDLETLNPKKADGGFYNYDGKKLTIQFWFESPQSMGFLKKQVFKSSKDSLQLQSENNIETYKVIPLPKSFLIYKPDW